MGRKRGGLIGQPVVPTGPDHDDSASGIWNLNDAMDETFPAIDLDPDASGVVSDVTLEVAEDGGTLVANFSGATDNEDGTILDYTILEESSLISVSPTTVTNTSSAQFTFTTLDTVETDTPVSFTVRVTDQYGRTDDNTSFSINVLDNAVPDLTSLTNDGLPDLSKGTTTTITWSGADDPDGTNTNLVYSVTPGSISDSNLTAQSFHSRGQGEIDFTVADISSDINGVTFGITVTDENGGSSKTADNAYSVNLKAVTFTAATGGTITYDGNYKIHTFTTPGTFEVTSLGTDTSADFLVVAGGGGGGSTSHFYSAPGGGGAGGYKTSYGSETSGGSCGNQTALTLAAQQYTISVGGGGAKGADGYNSGSPGSASSIAGSGMTTISTVGGGYGARSGYAGGNGGSGGGGGRSEYQTNKAGGTSTGCGNDAQAANLFGLGAGGAGAGSGGSGSAGGNGLTSYITGSTGVCRAAGGYTGTLYSGALRVNGCWVSTSVPNNDAQGSGGRGRQFDTAYWTWRNGTDGNDGVVIIRYKYQ